MSLRRAKTAGETADWVKQALLDVQDLRECLEYETEELGEFPTFLDPLEKGIEQADQTMRIGNYHFMREDLPFMELADKHAVEVPFHVLLKQINETHRRGLDVD